MGPLLDMDCSLLHFVFLEQVGICVLQASVGIWIFSSFVFALTVGLNPNVDHPDFAKDLDMHDTTKMPTQLEMGLYPRAHTHGDSGMAQQQSFGARGSMGPGSMGLRQSMAAHQSIASVAPASRHSFAQSRGGMGYDSGYDR